MSFDPRHRSHTLVDGPDRAAARSYHRAVGLTSDDLRKPLGMIAHECVGTMPCNYTQCEPSQHVMAGVRYAAGTAEAV